MAIDNPAFRDPAFSARGIALANSTATPEELQAMYEMPSARVEERRASGDVMTIQDVLVKSAVAFGLLVVGAAIGWFTIGVLPWLWIGAAVVGFVLALVSIFKREPSRVLILGYALAQGIFLGGISAFYEVQWQGIVSQAVIATLVVVAVTLTMFCFGWIRVSKTFTKIFLIAMIAYAVFSLVNLVLIWTGASSDPWGLRGEISIAGIPLGVILGAFAVLMGAYSLVMDFDYIQRGIENQAPRKYGWTGAFGIMVTVIWLYLEILRLLAIARR